MDHYELIDVVGEGTYGVVLKCMDRRTSRIVAVKRFKDLESNDYVKCTMLRELRVQQLLKGQPYVVQLLEAFKEKGRLYLVMEYVPHNLLDVLDAQPDGLSLEAIRVLMYTLLVSVRSCHRHGIIHRDIKPENILVRPNGRATLCDFGFSRPIASTNRPLLPPATQHLIEGLVVDGHDNIMTDYVATRWYRSPEMLLGMSRYSYAVDLWAVGAIMAELVDGQPLLPGQSETEQLSLIQSQLGPLPDSYKPSLRRKHVDRVGDARSGSPILSNPLRGPSKPHTNAPSCSQYMHDRFASRLGANGFELLLRLLDLDANSRIGVDDALEHSFFDGLDHLLSTARKREKRSVPTPTLIPKDLLPMTNVEEREDRRVPERSTSPPPLGPMWSPRPIEPTPPPVESRETSSASPIISSSTQSSTYPEEVAPTTRQSTTPVTLTLRKAPKEKHERKTSVLASHHNTTIPPSTTHTSTVAGTTTRSKKVSKENVLRTSPKATTAPSSVQSSPLKPLLLREMESLGVALATPASLEVMELPHSPSAETRAVTSHGPPRSSGSELTKTSSAGSVALPLPKRQTGKHSSTSLPQPSTSGSKTTRRAGSPTTLKHYRRNVDTPAPGSVDSGDSSLCRSQPGSKTGRRRLTAPGHRSCSPRGAPPSLTHESAITPQPPLPDVPSPIYSRGPLSKRGPHPAAPPTPPNTSSRPLSTSETRLPTTAVSGGSGSGRKAIATTSACRTGLSSSQGDLSGSLNVVDDRSLILPRATTIMSTDRGGLTTDGSDSATQRRLSTFQPPASSLSSRPRSLSSTISLEDAPLHTGPQAGKEGATCSNIATTPFRTSPTVRSSSLPPTQPITEKPPRSKTSVQPDTPAPTNTETRLHSNPCSPSRLDGSSEAGLLTITNLEEDDGAVAGSSGSTHSFQPHRLSDGHANTEAPLLQGNSSLVGNVSLDSVRRFQLQYGNGIKKKIRLVL